MIAQADIVATFESPWVRAALIALGLTLVLVLVREMRKVPGQLRILMATAFLDMVGMLMIVPLLPFYVKRIGGDAVEVFGVTLGTGALQGIVVSCHTVAQLVAAPLWGRFSDRFGRKPALLCSLGASAVAFLVFGFADSILVLMLSRIVQGAGGGTVGVVQAYVADSTEPENRARALGWLSAATNLGVALGPVLGSAAIVFGSFDLWPGEESVKMGTAAPGIFAAVLCLVTFWFAWRYLPESNPDRDANAKAKRTRPYQALLGVITRVNQPASRLILTYAIAIGSFHGINAVLALFLNARYQVTEDSIGYFYMYIGAIAVFTRTLILGRMVDRFGEARLSRIGIVTLATGICIIPLADSLGTLALGIGMLPLGTAFTFPCVTALLSRVTKKADRGLYMGLQHSYGGLSRAVAPLFFGWAFDVLGTGTPFFFSAAFVLSTIVLGFGLHKYSGKD